MRAEPTPRVAVVVPLYNKQHTIARAVASIRAQTVCDTEVIVVDDGSTDASWARLLAAVGTDPRFRCVRQPNAGPGAARNAGARLATAPRLAFLDADDAWRPTHLERALDAMARSGVLAYVAAYDTGAHQAVQANLLQQCIAASGPWSLPADLSPAQVKRMVDACQPGCLVIDRALFEHHGGFYDRERCTFGEDIWLMIQLVFGHTLWLEREPQVFFHVEDSELGVRRAGRHPVRPHLLQPEPLQQRCPPERRRQLAELFAYYRMLDTETLSRAGDWRAVARLLRRHRWPGPVPADYRLREWKIPLRAVAAALGWRGTAAG